MFSAQFSPTWWGLTSLKAGLTHSVQTHGEHIAAGTVLFNRTVSVTTQGDGGHLWQSQVQALMASSSAELQRLLSSHPALKYTCFYTVSNTCEASSGAFTGR